MMDRPPIPCRAATLCVCGAISEHTGGDYLSFPDLHRGSAYPVLPSPRLPVSDLPYPFQNDDPLSPGVLATYASAIRDEEIEHACVFDEHGTLLERLTGERMRIQFGHRALFCLTNTIFLHNHPRGSSFSLADIETACVFEMRSMMVVAGRGLDILMPPIEEAYFSRKLLRDIVGCYRIRSSAQSLSQRFEPNDGIWNYIAMDLSLRFWKMRLL
ncbi:MAG: hypothetical protein D5R99_03345 [Methanocalculus sp. MSAO_Arc1]|uniref:hypothetical protein n=1 Tax=Methanocalculus TaxID=71151 RepID=UPI000FF129D9|nr:MULTISPECIES: hypothetical protein [unclassified Methanocalculus]MCP1661515.1 hypothetical protein [Methanocalculus sp. AMF5]RQD81000.1 MAG: hypothetical protein D5R99_03345 [Methanocalculus sp. MSAO_Arc1]